MNANIFETQDYHLRTIKKQGEYAGQTRWVWAYRYGGKNFTCDRYYTTEHGAWMAGAKWIYKYLHEDIL